VEAVIKIGGSLAEDPERLKSLCRNLSELAKKHSIAVVPGGGKFADVVRDVDTRLRLSSFISHRMAILAMDQFGLLLSQFIPDSCATYVLDDVKQLSEVRAVPIFLPSRLMFKEDPLENSWNVTSDSIAAYVASRLGAKKVVLATDVDGIFMGGREKQADVKLLHRLSAAELLELNQRTSVDRFLPKLLLKVRINCFVINGKYPERLKDVLAGHETICTFISA
jgi:aspartokinase-like uncharacterized kinase